MKQLTSIAAGALIAATLAATPAAAGGLMTAPSAGCANFNGLYGGGNIGWAHNETDWVDRDAWVDNFSTDWALGTVSKSNDGVTGGLQAGYNIQRNCTLFGFEADANWADLGSSETHTATAGPGTVLTLNHDIDYWGTLRTRTGLIVDDLLLYVTGGLAYADIDHNWTINDPNTAPTTESFSISDWRWGGVGGIGTELAITERMTLRSELLYIVFSEDSTSGFSPNGPETVNFDSQDDIWVARFGVNVLLGGLTGGQ